mgnify:CR=1 FL=1
METTSGKIVLVEDDVRLAGLVKDFLEQHAFEVEIVCRGDQALERIFQEQPDMVILDLMLPGMDGLSVLKAAQGRIQAPVLILTAKEGDSDQISGLELGADDYVKKPVDPRVLLARIRVLLRRSRTHRKPVLEFGGLRIDSATRNVTLFGCPVDLSTSEFDTLLVLAGAPGQVLDRDYLYQAVKGIEYDGLDRSMDVAISRLRKKLEDHPEKPFRIKTIWGSGYLFAEDAWNSDKKKGRSL